METWFFCGGVKISLTKTTQTFFFHSVFTNTLKKSPQGKKQNSWKRIQEKHVICLHLHFQRPRVNNHKMNSQHQPLFILCHRDLCFSVRLTPSFLLHSHPKKSVWQVWLKVVWRRLSTHSSAAEQHRRSCWIFHTLKMKNSPPCWYKPD